MSVYLDRAVQTLSKFGIDIASRADERESQLVKLLGEVAPVDEARVLAISQVIGQMGAYNSLVRENVSDMNVAVRYQEINGAFQSVIDDTRMLIEHMADGKISLMEKAEQAVMKVRRGDISKRYDTVLDIADSVFNDTKKNLGLEEAISEAYSQFRLAVKSAESMSYEVLETQEQRLNAANESWKSAQSALDAFTGKQSEKTSLELARDEAAMNQKKEDRTYGLIKRIAENLKVGYNTGEVVMAKLQQSTEIKRGLYETGIIFFTTNEQVLTGMAATHKSMLTNREGAETLKQTYDGMKNNLEYLAELGGKTDDLAIQVTHGETIDANSLGKLVDAVVNYSATNAQKIAEARKRATANAQEVERIVDEGKKRVQDAILTYQPIKSN